MAFSITPTKIAPHNKSRVILIFGGLALLVSIAILVLNLNGLTEFTLKKIINATFELWGTSLGFGISAWICMNEIDGD